MNLTLPDDLADAVREEMPDVCVSKVLQSALRSMLSCDHVDLTCARCSRPIPRDEVRDFDLSRFYKDVLWELRELVDHNGTAEGAGVIIKKVAKWHAISAVDEVGLPRPPRSTEAATPSPSRRGGRCALSATHGGLTVFAQLVERAVDQ